MNFKSIKSIGLALIALTASQSGLAMEKEEPNDIFNAVKSNNKELLQYFIHNGGDVNSVEHEYAWPLLHVACAIAKNTHNLEIIKLLLENGADINAATKAGWTPLHAAAYQDIPIIIPTLIANGADINCKNWAGDTPLDVAKRLVRKDVIDVLCKEIEQQNIR
jgi:uncharacterized protein